MKHDYNALALQKGRIWLEDLLEKIYIPLDKENRMSQLSSEHKHILDRANAAIATGNIAEATELMKQIPVPLGLAQAAKQALGADFVRTLVKDFHRA